MDIRRAKRLPQLVAVLIAVLLSSEARADLLVGNSNGSTLSCSSGPCTPMNTNTTSLTLFGSNPWTLSTLPTSFDVTTNTPAVPLAALQMSTGGNNPNNSTANLADNLILSFTIPGGNFSDTLDLLLTGNPGGPTQASTLSGFSGLPLSVPLPGVTLSNFAFVSTGTGGSFSGATWSIVRGNSPGNTPTLTLEADVTATPAAVPEPSSFAVLGIALAGLGLVLGRRRAGTRSGRDAEGAAFQP